MEKIIPPGHRWWLNKIFTEWIPRIIIILGFTSFLSFFLFGIGGCNKGADYAWFFKDIAILSLAITVCLFIFLLLYVFVFTVILDWILYKIYKFRYERKNQKQSAMAKLFKTFAKGAFWLIILRILWEVLGYVPELVDQFMKMFI